MAITEEKFQARMAVLQEASRTVFGYPDGPRPFQLRVCEANLRNRSVFAVAPTGGGKSFCFQGPASIRRGLTVVISPLVALMKDQVDKLKRWGIPAERLGHDMPGEERARVYREMPYLSMIYVAPERLKSKQFREALAKCRLEGVALDEAHVLSRWGKEFRPSYAHLRPFIASHPGLPVTVLTATADREVEADLVRMLGLTDYDRVIGSPDRPNLEYTASFDMDHDDLVSMVSRQLESPGSALVYAASRKECENLSDMLGGAIPGGLAYYHAGMDPRLRTVTQERFLQGDIRAMVATNAFGMGVDKPDVRLVVHWHQPGSVFDYAQEAGRAGRDGQWAQCHLNISKKGTQSRNFMIRQANPDLWAYQKLWKIITADGKHGRGVNVRIDKNYINARMNLNEGCKGYTDSAMAFMEFNGHFEAIPGPVTYTLPVRNRAAALSFAKRYASVKVSLNVVKVTTDPDEDDPVPEMIAEGAVEARPPQETMILKLNRSELGITEEMIAKKRGAAEDSADAVIDFASAKDKPAFLRKVFLEAES